MKSLDSLCTIHAFKASLHKAANKTKATALRGVNPSQRAFRVAQRLLRTCFLLLSGAHLDLTPFRRPSGQLVSSPASPHAAAPFLRRSLQLGIQQEEMMDQNMTMGGCDSSHILCHTEIQCHLLPVPTMLLSPITTSPGGSRTRTPKAELDSSRAGWQEATSTHCS